MTLTAIKPTSSLTFSPPTPQLAPASSPGGLKSTAGTTADAKADHRIREVSREFEAMMVRQMLTSAGMGGNEKDGVYGGMEVDAVAKAVTQGRGLGLAQQIADSLARETHGHKSEGNPAQALVTSAVPEK
jgi:Rod binding domain-containing protein